MTSTQNMNQATKMDRSFIPDMPAGPLDLYRSKASFNWKEMKLHMEGEEGIKYKVAYNMTGVLYVVSTRVLLTSDACANYCGVSIVILSQPLITFCGYTMWVNLGQNNSVLS